MKKIIFKTDVIKGTRQFDKDSIIEGTLLYVGETHDLDRYPHSCPYLVFELKDGSIESFLLGAEVSVLGEDGISAVLTAKAPKQGNVAYGLLKSILFPLPTFNPFRQMQDSLLFVMMNRLKSVQESEQLLRHSLMQLRTSIKNNI